eukprot:NODE_4596_length_1042_cov_79.199129_g4393_i0.p1 GENE.NODE_4596_length_1042_cov_79.199129_g4393_i0~~NODE_4596_length_1042_cov_79.199129_g4393_i0.p1  ORF type:complete len:342 (+),score=68.44 NODE_4596_length_1042_cov_79.199129_g4393_i0:70-1026(+)
MKPPKIRPVNQGRLMSMMTKTSRGQPGRKPKSRNHLAKKKRVAELQGKEAPAQKLGAKKERYIHPYSRVAKQLRAKGVWELKKQERKVDRFHKTMSWAYKFEWFKKEVDKMPDHWVCESFEDLVEWTKRFIKRNDETINGLAGRRRTDPRMGGTEKDMVHQRQLESNAFNTGLEVPDIMVKKVVARLKYWDGENPDAVRNIRQVTVQNPNSPTLSQTQKQKIMRKLEKMRRVKHVSVKEMTKPGEVTIEKRRKQTKSDRKQRRQGIVAERRAGGAAPNSDETAASSSSAPSNPVKDSGGLVSAFESTPAAAAAAPDTA